MFFSPSVKSSNTLQETREELKGMAGVIQTSRNLLTKYGRREMTDKLLIFLALALFLATVIYILKKRIFWYSVTEFDDFCGKACRNTYEIEVLH